jgi:hypothetical protein
VTTRPKVHHTSGRSGALQRAVKETHTVTLDVVKIVLRLALRGWCLFDLRFLPRGSATTASAVIEVLRK